ncbi:MAG: hypothetical protein SRB2_03605 [Desulfobacteraceae bacterium Eth-SRB2]|nr:MAG: hypothetical protein SRB2_03605 [Desulfobacteraceae bacterium Eth-SRB2]
MTALTEKSEAKNNQNITEPEIIEDEFLTQDDLVPVKKEAVKRELSRILAELELMIREKKWEDAASLFYPVEEKLPEVTEQGLDSAVREKLAFILGQVKKFDEAIKELSLCIAKNPDNFFLHNSLAYTAYNSLYAAKNREIFLSGKIRRDRIALAHKHFKVARALRPDSITNFYREAMLFKQIEGKSEKALPLFLNAIKIWDQMSLEEKESQHRQRKNFVKALYQGAAAALENGHCRKSLNLIKRCLVEDEKTDYISLVFKYYALGKISFQLNNFTEARDALLFAAKCKSADPIDFVYELLARCYLALDNPRRALEMLKNVPKKRRKPYISWTESDVLSRLKDYAGAKNALNRSLERDNRSKHKTLVRLAKLEYLLGNYDRTLACARQANSFFEEKWGNPCGDGLFWQALGAYRMGDLNLALKTADRLKDISPNYHNLDKLLDRVARKGDNCEHLKAG